MLVLDDAEVGHRDVAVADAPQYLELGCRCPRIDDRHLAGLRLGDDQVVDRQVTEVEAVAGGIEPHDVVGRRIDEEHTACGAIDWRRCGCRGGGGCGSWRWHWARRQARNGDPRQSIKLSVGERNTTLELDTAGEGTGQTRIVINRHLVGDVITAQINVRKVIRLRRTTDQGAEINVDIGQTITETIPAHARGLPAVRLLGEVIAIAHQIAGFAGVRTEDVIHGLLRQGRVGAIWIIHAAGIDISQKSRVGGIAERAPLADPAQAARCDRHTIATGHPVVQPALHLLLDRR